MTEEQLYNKLHDKATDLVVEASYRGETLSFNIAWMRVVGRYNCNQKEWLRAWREEEKRRKANSTRLIRLFE
jgi:hypothetical protein